MATYRYKLIFFTLLLCLGGLQAQAQDSLQTEPKTWSKLSIGTRHGAGISFIFEPNNVLTGSSPNLTTTLGYTGGLSVQYYAQPNFSLQFGVNYTEKGWEENFVTTVNNEPRVTDSLFFRQQLNYIDVPIMAHGYVGQRNVRIYLEAGFFLSYLLSHSSEREISITDEQIAYQYEEGRDNRFNIGIAAGGGFEIVTAVGMFQLGGRYSLGFSSVLDKNITPVPNPLMMNSIMITLGYYVRF
ncbi:porin family protein [Catalinimonas niigatensis]|uniref:porin family protein n=1 Tax=Catalinimonas niigatensis TaxID=1397264 RepID=UPI002665C504|nr:porin family protein [Catalinimonas niigatensis]WPP48376.1 porin family protein [Catalinimonas niigatensis]